MNGQFPGSSTGCGCPCSPEAGYNDGSGFPPPPHGQQPAGPRPPARPDTPPKVEQKTPENSKTKPPVDDVEAEPETQAEEADGSEEVTETENEETETETQEQRAFKTVDKHFKAIDNSAKTNLLGNDDKFVKKDLEEFLKQNSSLPAQEREDIQFIIDNFDDYADGHTFLNGKSISKEQVEKSTGKTVTEIKAETKEEKSIKTLYDNFDSVAKGDWPLGPRIGQKELEEGAQNHQDPEVRAACDYFLKNPEAFDRLDVAAGQLFQMKDGYVGKDDLITALTNVKLSPVDHAYLGQVGQLNEKGDICTLSAGATVGVKGVKVAGDGDITIRHNGYNEDGSSKGYTVRAGGKVGAGVGLDSKIGTKNGVDANVSGHIGAHVEYTFDTPEEASKAAGILSAKAVGGPIAFGVTGLNGDDKFLADNISAIEFDTGVAGRLGIKSEIGRAGISGSVGIAARIEFKDGKPPELVFRETVSVEGKVSLGLGENKAIPEKGTGLDRINAFNKGAKATVTVEQRFPLNLSQIDSIFNDPIGTIARTVDLSKAEVSVKARFEGERKEAASRLPMLPNGGGLCVELELSGKPSALLNKELLIAVANGDLAKHLNDNITAKLRISNVVTSGVNVDAGVKILGTGVDGRFTAERKNHIVAFETEGKPSQVFVDLYNQMPTPVKLPANWGTTQISA